MTALVAFDLDDTLAESKSPIDPAMTSLLLDLLRLVPVCIISGGRFQQFQDQVLRFLPPDRPELADLHLMPTCGTRYLRWEAGSWTEVYAEDLSEREVREATVALEECARSLGLWESDDQVYGERVEDRGSQVTLSALGQRAPVVAKKAWDPSGAKREALRSLVQERLPDLEVRAGGSTSIDITRKGIDKAYGMRSLTARLDIEPADVLFVGDRLEPGGNDFPVVALGVMTHAVSGWQDTLRFLPGLVEELRSSSLTPTGAGGR